MDYQRLYDDLIIKTRSESRVKVKGGIYYEAHHIIPKCLGGEGKYSQWRTHPNIILLTAKEHFMAHYYLTKIHPQSSQLSFAFWGMCNQANKYQGRSYDEVVGFSELYEEAKIRASAAMSLTNSGRKQSPEHVAKRSAGRKGKPSSGRGKKRGPLSPEALAKREATRIANGTTGRGRKRGPHSAEARSKMSAARKGKPQSPEHKAKRAAAQVGRRHSPESIAKALATKLANGTGEGWKLPLEVVTKRCKPVSQYTKGGEWIRDWTSAKEAGTTLSIDRGDITTVCKGRRVSAGGYIWRYKS